MISQSEIVLSLRGAFRLGLRDTAGLRDFNVSIAGFWRSFTAALIVAPGYAALIGPRIAALSAGAAWRAVLVEILGYVIIWTAFPLAMHHLAPRIGRDDAYIRFIVAHNWGATVQMMILLTATAVGGSLPGGAGVLLQMIGLGLILYYQWFVARTALAVSGGTAAAIVALGILIEFAVTTAATVMGAPAPQGGPGA